MNTTETADAQAILARIAQPLDASDRDTCAKMGISEADYKAERDRALSAKLPSWYAGMGNHGLDTTELKVCQALGVSPEDYTAEKNKIAAEKAQRG
jgi:hypothetical protein